MIGKAVREPPPFTSGFAHFVFSFFQRVGQVVHIACDAIIFDDLSGTLQQARVQVEYITWVGLTSWRTTKQQRYLTVSYGLLRQIIINDQCRTASITEIFSDGSTGKGCIKLQWCRIRAEAETMTV
jgi:hypothetical protein